MNYNNLKEYINSDKINETLKKCVCLDELTLEKKRYLGLLERIYKKFGDNDYHFISSPGRSEIGGNHTDHQHGNIVAATLSIDNVAVFGQRDDNIITFYDDHFDEVKIDISDLSKREDEKNTTASLIRGIASKLKEEGYKIGGFNAICDSKVLIGASISSSACFEVMIVEIFNSLYNNHEVSPVKRAIYSQYAENNYFGKACGLLDQLTISVGGFVTADFKDPNNPKISNYDFSFDDYGYDFLIVNTKGSHANLSDEYSAMPFEMKSVAKVLGKDVLADTNYEDFIHNLSNIRDQVKNDRSIMRAYHFFKEDKRAKLEKAAIDRKDINELLKLMIDSGRSSYMYLQNVYSVTNYKSQGIAIALALSDDFIKDGAYRIQGGGFEGTIIAVVNKKDTADYVSLIESVFKDDSVLKCSIRPCGTIEVI